MKRFTALLLAGVALGWALPAMAQDAEIGPELVVYTGTGLPADLADRLVEPFSDFMEEKYGTPVLVRTVPGAIPTSWLTLQTEWPNPTGDVYLLYNQNIRTGIENGYFMPLEPEFTPEEWASFDAGAMETLATDGYSAPMEISAWMLAVQDSVPEDQVTSLADFTRPELSRRITFDSLAVGSGYNAIAAAANILDVDWRDWFVDGVFNEEAARPTFELVSDWADNALTLTQGSGTIIPLLRRGEALASAWWWHNIMFEIEEGTPIRAVQPTEGTIAIVQSGPVISSATDNPVAAVEWVKFVHSEYASEAALEVNYLNRLPRAGEPGSPQWDEFAATAEFVWIDEFRDAMLDPANNEQILDLYNRVVIQGQ